MPENVELEFENSNEKVGCLLFRCLTFVSVMQYVIV